MPKNDFFEFATSSAAYVESLPDYLADVERTAGQQSGIARAELNNRALRQGSAMAAAIGSFMSAQGYDALDDGDTATRAADFAAAVAALIQPSITSAVNAAKTDVLQRVFPVGSFYTSYNIKTDPAQLLGFGTWTAVQGRFLLSASSAYPAASTGGAASHAITVAELPPHSHTGSATSAGKHTHTATTASAGAHTHAISVASAGAHTHSASIGNSGEHHHGSGVGWDRFPNGSYGCYDGAYNHAGFDGGDMNNPIWKTSTNGSHSHSANIHAAGAHVHNASSASAGAHTHTVTVATAGAHTHTVTIGDTGGGATMSLLPPYVAVYMWRRTA